MDSDMHGAFSAGRSLFNSLSYLSNTRERLKAFYQQSPDKVSLCYFQYFQLAAAAYDWKPDLIIELGRAYGNSTFVFTEVMNETGGEVISLCNKEDWHTIIVPRIRNLVDNKWQSHLDARVVDNLAAIDLNKEINAKKRVMIFWDAHGFQTAEYVLGYLLPLMKNKQCLVLMHDITDRRFYEIENSYQGQRLWRPEIANEGSVKVSLDNFTSSSEQLISVLDFCSRNHLELNSADESLRSDLNEAEKKEIQEKLQEGFNLQAHWVYFMLDQSVLIKQLHFPLYSREHLLLEDKFTKQELKWFFSQLSKPEFDSYSRKFGFYRRLKLALRILAG